MHETMKETMVLEILAADMSVWLIATLGCLTVFVILTTCVMSKFKSDILVSWPLIGVFPQLIVNSRRLHDWISECLISKGGTVTISTLGVNVVVTSDPENMGYVIKGGASNYKKGAKFKEAMRDMLGDGVLLNYDDHFRSLHMQISLSLKSESFRSSAMEVAQHFLKTSLLPRLKQAASSPSRSVDMQEWLSEFTFCWISKAGLSVDPTCLPGAPNATEFLHAFQSGLELSVTRIFLPSFLWKTLRFFGLRSEERMRQIVWNWLGKAVQFRKLYPKSNLVTDDLVPPDYQNPDWLLSVITAGEDTIATALTWFFWNIHQHPDVEGKILNELHSVVKRTGNASFTAEDTREMNYLHAALSESLRLFPPVPLEVTEAVEEDVLPDGTLVPKGSVVIYSIKGLGRRKDVWGDDADTFRPERWLNDNGEFVFPSEFKFMAFNAGCRRCLGRDVAYLLMKLVASTVLFGYKVSVVPGHSTAPKLSITMPMKYGLPVTVLERQEVAHVSNPL